MNAKQWYQRSTWDTSHCHAFSFLSTTMQMCAPIRAPTWFSSRLVLEQTLAELHNCNNLNQVKQLQAQIFKSNLHRDRFVASKLIASFAQSRQIALAVNVFNLVPEPDARLYNSLIRAQAHSSQPSQALETFLQMQSNGVFADNFTYPFLLKACSGLSWLRMAEMLHTHIVKFGFCSDIFVPNSLIDCYSKFGDVGVRSAAKVFRTMEERDVVSWNSMIGGLVKAGELGKARYLFDKMPQRDVVTWNTVLDGYVKAGEMDAALKMFERMPMRNVVSWCTMVSGYSEAGDMEMARLLFDKMPVKNMVLWIVLIAGYAKNGFVNEAICLFERMEKIGLKLDEGAIVSVLSACAQSSILGLGMMVHAYIERTRFSCSTKVSNALVDMYAKCGNLVEALSVFRVILKKDMVSWNTMIHGLATHGHGDKALLLFSRMKREGYEPDDITLISVLCACTHAGLVDEGLNYFNKMKKDYGLVPKIEHYGCMVDLLGRGGYLKDAFMLTLNMPMEPNVVIWGSLLSACKMHNAVELAEEVLDYLVKLENSDPGNYSMVSNIFAASGDWDSAASARLQMKIMGRKKQSGASSIEVDNEVHEFTVADTSHHKTDMIYLMVDSLQQDLKQEQYDPTSAVIALS